MVFFPSGSSFLRAPLGRCLIWRPEKRTRSRFVTSRSGFPFLFFSEKKRDGWIILLPLDRVSLSFSRCERSRVEETFSSSAAAFANSLTGCGLHLYFTAPEEDNHRPTFQRREERHGRWLARWKIWSLSRGSTEKTLLRLKPRLGT